MKFDFDWPSGFWEEDVKSVDDVRRATEAYLSYKLTKWAFGSAELNMQRILKIENVEKVFFFMFQQFILHL